MEYVHKQLAILVQLLLELEGGADVLLLLLCYNEWKKSYSIYVKGWK